MRLALLLDCSLITSYSSKVASYSLKNASCSLKATSYSLKVASYSFTLDFLERNIVLLICRVVTRRCPAAKSE